MADLKIENARVAGRAVQGGSWTADVDPDDGDSCRAALKAWCKRLKLDPTKHVLKVRANPRSRWISYRL